MKYSRFGVIAAGLALFSMFFGAGDLIWPLILGGRAGDQNFYSMLGFLISGVSLPLLGLLSMLLFYGNTKAFFGRVGAFPGFVLLFIIQAILGPLGTLPRSITLAHATIEPYLSCSLPIFSLLASVFVFFLAFKKQRMVDILGMVLAPFLLLCLGAILFLGFRGHPEALPVATTHQSAFMEGLRGGYNTLDMIASFIFAPLVISYFRSHEKDDQSVQGRRHVFKKMVAAGLIAGGLLSIMFFGLTYVASYYTHLLPPHDEAQRLGLISLQLLGSQGALVACIAVALSCLTTAIPIAAISADYIQNELTGGKCPRPVALAIPLALSVILANLGFMGIARMLGPVLQIICPGLIILCVFNILHKLYEMETPRLPVFAAFGLSLIGYFALPYLS